MTRPKITEPLTDNEEKARRTQREETRRHGAAGPSRAQEPKSGGESEKKRSETAPKHGGRTRS